MSSPEAPMSLLSADGRAVAWSECGAPRGTPVLWFHGAPGSRRDAAPDGPFAASYAAAGVRVIAVDRPGYGSTDPAPTTGFEQTATDAALVADALELSEFAVLGYSAGGAAAVMTAALLGPRVTAVGVLAGIAPPSLADHSDLAERDLFDLGRTAPDQLAGQLVHLAEALRTDTPAAAMDLLAGALSDDDLSALANPALAALLMATLAESARQDLIGYADDVRTLLDDWAPALSAVTQPVRIVHGAGDRVVPPRHGRALAAAVPRADYHEVAGGHISVLMGLPSVVATLVG